MPTDRNPRSSRNPRNSRRGKKGTNAKDPAQQGEGDETSHEKKHVEPKSPPPPPIAKRPPGSPVDAPPLPHAPVAENVPPSPAAEAAPPSPPASPEPTPPIAAEPTREDRRPLAANRSSITQDDLDKIKLVRRVIVQPRRRAPQGTRLRRANLPASRVAPALLGRLKEKYPGIRVVPLVGSDNADKLAELTARARRRRPEYRADRLQSAFAFEAPTSDEPEALAREIESIDPTLRAYAEPRPVKPPRVVAKDDTRSVHQKYLNAARKGVDAEAAWGEDGGAGEGQVLVDVEWGWDDQHRDLVGHRIERISGLNDLEIGHGTSVLGIVAAHDDEFGHVGIAPRVQSVRCVSPWRSKTQYHIADAILDALWTMEPGDVLLVEQQTDFAGESSVPAESDPAIYDVIELATSLGIVVIEAAGNGGVDLDAMTYDGAPVFDPDYDSGAILVGAASSAATHPRSATSCHGSRVDCFAWGDSIDSPDSDGDDHQAYTTSFGGTSGASAIIAGVVLCMQGIAAVRRGRRLEPQEVRTILRRAELGTASKEGVDDRIGVMPNLRAILDSGVLDP